MFTPSLLARLKPVSSTPRPELNRRKQREQRCFLRFLCLLLFNTLHLQDRVAWVPRYLNLNSAWMLWHEAVRNAFLQIQEANPFSARLVGRFISESRFSLWVQRRFRK